MQKKRDIRNRAFEEQRLEIDGRDFHGCSFTNCVLLFEGREASSFDPTCEFEGVSFELRGAAQQTMLLLQALHGNGFLALRESLLNAQPSPGWTSDTA